jgi:glycine/serine hydroxymethyltransferase
MTLTNWMSDIILDLSNKNKVEEIKKEVSDLCKQFPVYK